MMADWNRPVRMPGTNRPGTAEHKSSTSSPVHRQAGRASDLSDRSDELIADALRVNAQTEEIGGATLDQMRRQGEQHASSAPKTCASL